MVRSGNPMTLGLVTAEMEGSEFRVSSLGFGVEGSHNFTARLFLCSTVLKHVLADTGDT